MARITGYTCTAAVRVILEKKFHIKGIFPPEIIGQDKKYFNFIINELAKRNVNFNIAKEITE